MEFKELQKEEIEIRNKLNSILEKHISTIDDDYSDIQELIENLISNEIEQEKFCNQ